MKAALGQCVTVHMDKRHAYLVIKLPAPTLLAAQEIFRDQRVLVTLASSELQAEPDGIKQGRWRSAIPVLTDVVQALPRDRFYPAHRRIGSLKRIKPTPRPAPPERK